MPNLATGCWLFRVSSMYSAIAKAPTANRQKASYTIAIRRRRTLGVSTLAVLVGGVAGAAWAAGIGGILDGRDGGGRTGRGGCRRCGRRRRGGTGGRGRDRRRGQHAREAAADGAWRA